MDFTGLFERLDVVRGYYTHDRISSDSSQLVVEQLNGLRAQFIELLAQAEDNHMMRDLLFQYMSAAVNNLEDMLERRNQILEEYLAEAVTVGNA